MALVVLAAAIAIAPDRRRALHRAGVALAVAAVVLVAILLIGRGLLPQALGPTLPPEAGVAPFDALAQFLWFGAIALLALGAGIAMLAVAGHRQRPASSATGS